MGGERQGKTARLGRRPLQTRGEKRGERRGAEDLPVHDEKNTGGKVALRTTQEHRQECLCHESFPQPVERLTARLSSSHTGSEAPPPKKPFFTQAEQLAEKVEKQFLRACGTRGSKTHPLRKRRAKGRAPEEREIQKHKIVIPRAVFARGTCFFLACSRRGAGLLRPMSARSPVLRELACVSHDGSSRPPFQSKSCMLGNAG